MRAQRFYEKTLQACADRPLADKLKAATNRQLEAREASCGELEDVEALKQLAADVRDHALSNLDTLLESFSETLERNGVHVHFADDARDARSIIVEVAEDRGVKSVVKGKSMVTEEIGLNKSLEERGIEVIETDLGEFIIQLAGQPPSHIVLPAVHLSTSEVAGIFREKIGYDGPPDPEALTKAARVFLRKKFAEADMGISGVNFALAEEGAWLVCTNEGNGRYVMNMPKTYVAVMGAERIVQGWQDASVMLKLLGRFATGQRITQYVNAAGGPCSVDGPEEVHLVILDNGRSKILSGRYWRMLRCIRCGACLNVCPVFELVGGQSFPGCYSGPMGSVLLPLMLGHDAAGQAAKACSLCRACMSTCPVKIPLADLLIELRSDLVSGGCCSMLEKAGMSLAAFLLGRPMLYRLSQRLLRLGLRPLSRDGWVKYMPSLPGGWTGRKDLPLPAKESFLTAMKKEDRKAQRKNNP